MAHARGRPAVSLLGFTGTPANGHGRWAGNAKARDAIPGLRVAVTARVRRAAYQANCVRSAYCAVSSPVTSLSPCV